MFPEKIDPTKVIGLVNKSLPELSTDNSNARKIKVKNRPSCLFIESLLDVEESKNILNYCLNSPLVTMQENTIKEHYGYGNTGIQRSSFYDIEFANQLYNRLKPFISEKEIIENKSYQLIGLNPLIRFIFYKESHSLIPHYDIPVNIKENIITLKTIVLYLNNVNSGHTNFLEEIRTEHNYQDSHQQHPVLESIQPQIGNAIIFDHWKLHESASVKKSEEKYILTTELAYLEV